MDGDGIPYRTLPGTHPKGAYFTRGSGHNKFGAYTEDADEYTEVVDRIDRKIQRATQGAAGAGCPPSAGGEARHPDGRRLPRAPATKRSTCWRRKASRSTTCASAASRSATRWRSSSSRTRSTFVVEQNRDAQLRSLLQLETGVPIEKMESVRYYGGFPMSAHHVISGIKASWTRLRSRGRP